MGRHFSCKFWHDMALSEMSMCISIAQARTKRVPNFWGATFFLQTLAQNGFFEMFMCISTAQARAKSAPRCSHALGLWHFHREFSLQRVLVEIPLNSSLRGPCMILHRSLTEDLVEILSYRCLYESSCGKLLWGLVRSAPASRSFYDALVSFS